MKASISKGIFGLLTLTLCAACSPDNSMPQTDNLEVQVVEEITPTAPLPPAEKPTTVAASSQPAPQAKTAPAKPATQIATPTYTIQELMEQLKKQEKNLTTFQADFNQVSLYDGVEINRSQGRLYYDFPSKLLRWEVLTREGDLDQVGITNKQEIIILDDTLKPVTTLSWKEWQQGQANQALFDIGNYAQLANEHEVNLVKQDDKQAQLAFTPKNKKENYTLFITLSKHNFSPEQIAVEADGMLTTNELFSIHKNKPFPPELFGGFFE